MFEGESVSLRLRQEVFNVLEGDIGETTYVLVEADILSNTLQTPALLHALIQSPMAISMLDIPTEIGQV